ncbi:MAG: thiamine-monophosphate kinase [Lysobacterales bacterium]|jgi:thiamine-monophosphate kinase
MGEFQLIEWIRSRIGPNADDTIIGIGDDAAVLALPKDQELVITTDTLNAGVHFDDGISAADLGHKALAVNLSDLAAMGATPRWVLLSISIPELDQPWLEEFVTGFLSLAETFRVSLVGGDTCLGGLSISVTAIGQINAGMALGRKGARPGDLIVVSGTLGDAALALSELRKCRIPDDSSLRALYLPLPRIALGASLVGKASACIDISDGLLADLGHIVNSSACGGILELDKLPASTALRCHETETQWTMQLSGGEDYELCFSISPDREAELQSLGKATGSELSIIGRMVEGSGVVCVKPDGNFFELECTGYQHFT